MSLTRAEWEAMWQDLKRIEALVPRTTDRHARILDAVVRIKKQVESVIGQME